MPSQIKKELLSGGYGTNQEDPDSESVPAMPVWSRGWAKQICTCNSTTFYVHYLFIFYFFLLFVDSFLHGVDIGWIFLFNTLVFLIQVGCAYSMVLGRMLLSTCIGGSLVEVLLWPFGMFSTQSEHLSSKSSVCLALGEITFLFPILSLCWYIWVITPSCEFDFLRYDRDWDTCFAFNVSAFGFMCASFLIFFNLFVPVYPLHGSFALVGILNYCQLHIETMARCVIITATLYFVFFTGIAVVYHNWLSAMVSVFILWQTWTVYQHYQYHGLQFHPLFEDLDIERKKTLIEKVSSVLAGNQETISQKDVHEAAAGLLSTPYQVKQALDYAKPGAYEAASKAGNKAFEEWLSSAGPKRENSSEDEVAPLKTITTKKASNVKYISQEVLTVDSGEDYEIEDDQVFQGAYDDM